MITFHIFSRRGVRGKRWYFRGVAANNRTILQSEGYRNHDDCWDTVWQIRNEAGDSKVDDSEHEAGR